MRWLAEGDPVKLKTVAEMPVIDFFILLNKKMAETKVILHKQKKGRAK